MNLDYLMTQNKITQNELGDKIKVDAKTISNYRNNKGTTTVNNFIKLADYFNVSLDYLCDRQFNNQIGYIREDRKELIKMINEMSENDVKEISAYVKGYIAGKSGNTNFKIFG